MSTAERVSAVSPFATTAMHGRVEALRESGERVIDFSIAISLYAPPEVVRDTVALTAVEEKLTFTTVCGAQIVRLSQASKLRRENDIDAGPDEIIATNYAKQAFYDALCVLTDPRDVVIVFRPYWWAYLATAELLELKVHIVELPVQLDSEYLACLPVARIGLITGDIETLLRGVDAVIAFGNVRPARALLI